MYSLEMLGRNFFYKLLIVMKVVFEYLSCFEDYVKSFVGLFYENFEVNIIIYLIVQMRKQKVKELRRVRQFVSRKLGFKFRFFLKLGIQIRVVFLRILFKLKREGLYFFQRNSVGAGDGIGLVGYRFFCFIICFYYLCFYLFLIQMY